MATVTTNNQVRTSIISFTPAESDQLWLLGYEAMRAADPSLPPLPDFEEDGDRAELNKILPDGTKVYVAGIQTSGGISSNFEVTITDKEPV